MDKQRFTWEDWDALSPERRDQIQKEVAAIEDPNHGWGESQDSDEGS